jgi:hypothetical protein
MKTWLVISWAELLLILARFLDWSSTKMRGPIDSLIAMAILPCPKCGGKGESYYEQGMESTRVIVCAQCEYWGKGVPNDLLKAISLWNRKR